MLEEPGFAQHVLVGFVLHAGNRLDPAGDEDLAFAGNDTLRGQAMVCSPEEQKRFTVIPGNMTGQPARKAICRAMLHPVAPSGKGASHEDIVDLGRIEPARSIACVTTWAPSVAPWVILKAPRQDFASAVRAVETMTASVMMRFRGTVALARR